MHLRLVVTEWIRGIDNRCRRRKLLIEKGIRLGVFANLLVRFQIKSTQQFFSGIVFRILMGRAAKDWNLRLAEKRPWSSREALPDPSRTRLRPTGAPIVDSQAAMPLQ